MVGGLPLYAHSIRHARESGLFDRIVVSSDAPEVLAKAEGFGADWIVNRPVALASDKSAKVPAIAHAVVESERHFGEKYEVCVDLDATSPLRVASDIVGAVALLESSGADSVITGSVAHRSPYFNLVEEDSRGHVSVAKKLPEAVLRRQDAPRTFDMNASVYVWKRNRLVDDQRVFFETTRLFEMPAERSLDIDSELDFKIVEFLLTNGGTND